MNNIIVIINIIIIELFDATIDIVVMNFFWQHYQPYNIMLLVPLFLVICPNRPIGLVEGVFANGPGDRGTILIRVIRTTQKWYLIPSCLTLSIIRYVSRVKWSNPGKGLAPFHYLGVVAIEGGAFGRPTYYGLNSIIVALQQGWLWH